MAGPDDAPPGLAFGVIFAVIAMVFIAGLAFIAGLPICASGPHP